jgi:hypothetical protein
MTLPSRLWRKREEKRLQYTLTFNNPEFNNLLNAVSYLHGAVFPLTPVSSVAITRSEVSGAAVITSKVTGKIISIEKTKP